MILYFLFTALAIKHIRDAFRYNLFKLMPKQGWSSNLESGIIPSLKTILK